MQLEATSTSCVICTFLPSQTASELLRWHLNYRRLNAVSSYLVSRDLKKKFHFLKKLFLEHKNDMVAWQNLHLMFNLMEITNELFQLGIWNSVWK
jgi:hypothetical protein